MIIREFTPSDYEVFAAVTNAVYPDYPESADEMRRDDARRQPHILHGRFLAELDGRVVGTADYDQHAGQYQPQVFALNVAVLPEYRNRGVGSALYDRLMRALAPFDPLKIKGNAREDWTHSVRFLEARGFEEAMRTWESRLDPRTFDGSAFAGHLERLEAQGVRLVSYAELDPATRDRRFYEVFCRVRLDVPRTEPATEMSYEFFLASFPNEPTFVPEACIFAEVNGELAGMSNVWLSDVSDDLFVGLTGVLPEYRRRGLALGMKLRTLEWARAHGAPSLKTWNASNNLPMLAINEQLGFVKQPAWIDFARYPKSQPQAALSGAAEAR
ncbi:GNAT superfamily N-acetyltransferase [Deinobacterium chartae]|uniref:GNAT superfamily N-acetyltransferase n=1 Tax=Deinobacterium chartae TaxID=521158 RepID=A0A841HZ41_9DEIO|nr:GNAT family N-acetyltransferase [Deinobacterium chartae]MBB6097480.1 GNAT superfamily N-acetyltransferase [Deinobacterium chartae]